MIRYLFTIISVLLFLDFCVGQDKIITRDGKNIDCKIIYSDSSNLYFKTNAHNNYINTSLKLADISSYVCQGVNIQISELDSLLVAKRLNNVAKNRYDATDKRSSKNALNIGLIGIQKSVISLNYERLLDQKYGIAIGLTYFNTKELSVGFRNHIKNSMNSFYWGFFINYFEFENRIEATGYKLNEYKYKMTNLFVGPNVGKRWIDKSGFNFSLRFGYGFSIDRNFNWIDIPEDEQMKDDSESVLNIISGFDTEISAGYCF